MKVLAMAKLAVTSQSCPCVHAGCKASTVPQPDQLTLIMLNSLVLDDDDRVMVKAVNIGVEQVMDGVRFMFVVGSDISLAILPDAPISCMFRLINGKGWVRMML